MNPTIDQLVRGSEKIINHYRWLLNRAETDSERTTYERRIAEEERLLQQLFQSSPGTIQT
ncbi:hypothetical protein ABIF90_000126 [Bradyrhizobium japonicum]